MGACGGWIHEAGWPVYPVIALCLTTLLVALRHAAWPQRGTITVIVGLGTAGLLMALLGTALGVDATIEAVTRVEPERRWIVLIGIKESLRNVEIALLLLLPAALLATVGARRLPGREP